MLETGILAHGHFLFLKNREEYSKSELEIIEDLALKLSFFTFSISFDGSLPEDFDLLEDSLILFTPNNVRFFFIFHIHFPLLTLFSYLIF